MLALVRSLAKAFSFSADMSRVRRAVVIATLVLPVGSALYAMIDELELWPLSAYRMYSNIETGTAVAIKAVVVDAHGREKPISPRIETKRIWLANNVRALDKEGRRRLASELACQHDILRARGTIRGPAEATIRIYTNRWEHNGDPRRPITRRMLAEGRCR